MDRYIYDVIFSTESGQVIGFLALAESKDRAEELVQGHCDKMGLEGNITYAKISKEVVIQNWGRSS